MKIAEKIQAPCQGTKLSSNSFQLDLNETPQSGSCFHNWTWLFSGTNKSKSSPWKPKL